MRQFNLLGTISIHDDQTLSPLMKSPKGYAIVAYLAVEGGWQPRETVADMFWDATSTQQSLKNLRSLLNRIRKWAPEIQVTRKAMAFELLPNSHVDLFKLRAGLNSEDLDSLDTALRHYSGELLQGFYLVDAPRLNEWLTVAREQLQRQVQVAYRRLCLGYQAQKKWQIGADAALRWVALDNLNEEAHRMAMVLLAEDGNVTAALHQYELCRQLLWEELGVAPEDVTQALAEQIETMEAVTPELGDKPVAWGGEDVPDPAPLPSNSMVPYHRNNDFTGRTADLLTIARELLLCEVQSKPPAVAVSGMGGMGKTQLAVEFAFRFGRYFNGVYWISFAQADNIVEEVANSGGVRGLKLYQEDDQLTLADQVGRVQQAWQEPIRRLLIFDNCEDEGLLKEWLPVTGGCHILITSRQSRWSRELGISNHPLNLLGRDESVALLSRLIESETQPQPLRKIAAELGDLPLALHLAGSFLNRYRRISAEQYIDQLSRMGLLRHPSLQGHGTTHSPTNHELNVARTFDLNYAQLDSDDEIDAIALRLLAYAACFAPAEPIPHDLLLDTLQEDDAEDLMMQLLAEDGLSRLVKLGFLRLEEQDTIIMHHLLAQFAQDISAEANAHTIVTQSFHQKIRNSSRRDKSDWYSLPFPLVHCQHLIATFEGDPTIAIANLTHAVGLFAQHRADFTQSQTYLQLSLSYYKTIYGERHPLVANILSSLGNLFQRNGAYDEAQSYFTQAITLLQNSEEDSAKPETLGAILNNLGYLLLLRGNYQPAKTTLEQSLSVHEQALGPEHAKVAISLSNLGVALLNLGDYVRAEAVLQRSLTIRSRELGNEHPYTAVSLQNLGLLHIKTEAYDLAQQYLDLALTVRKRAVGLVHPHTARSFNALAELSMKLGELPLAQSYLAQALAIQDEILQDDHPEKASTFKNLGVLHELNGEVKQAHAHYRRALAIWKSFAAENHPDRKWIQARLRLLDVGVRI